MANLNIPASIMPLLKRVNTKRNTRRARKTTATKRVAKLAAPVKRAVKQIVRGQEETKYISYNLVQNQRIDPAIHTPGTDCLPLVPKIPQGLTEAQRVGVKVRPTKCRLDVSVSFSQDQPGSTASAWTQYAQQIYVVMYVLRSKVYKNWNQWQASTNFMDLLDNGDGTSTTFGSIITPTVGSPFYTASTVDMMKPIETSAYTLLKKRVIKLTKNVGQTDLGLAGSAQVPNLPQTSYSGSFYYRLPTLQYDDTPTVSLYAGYPTNANVLFAVGYCFADNMNTYMVDGNNDPQAPNDQVSITARNHIWYKDA